MFGAWGLGFGALKMLLKKFEIQSLIATAAQLRELLPQIEPHDRVAVDTEADSLHSYREKLCLLQLSLSANRTDSSRGEPTRDYIVDPLAGVDLAPLRDALQTKEIVLHGADFDLRLLHRSLDFTARRIFDTVIAARLLGIREFSLAALLERFFDVKLAKGSQKANWARRPLSPRMLEYATNDTHYLLPLAERLETELQGRDRLEWLRQSCRRAVEQAAMSRVRDEDETWRISGSGSLKGRAAAVLRALWRWRESEAAAVDRPPFHILQNHELLHAAESFALGSLPDYRHFSPRRRRAFCDAAQSALKLPEEEWPVLRRRFGTRPSAEVTRRSKELRLRRDRVARELELEPTFIAPRATLEAIAADQTRATALLVPWQRELLRIDV
ncbi:MAG: 3'-5' exonuclease [Verrucomicrobia bacterium]|nr:MAG: 3'-5' exonuclease [Verrucomicrobiota bacterium]